MAARNADSKTAVWRDARNTLEKVSDSHAWWTAQGEPRSSTSICACCIGGLAAGFRGSPPGQDKPCAHRCAPWLRWTTMPRHRQPAHHRRRPVARQRWTPCARTAPTWASTYYDAQSPEQDVRCTSSVRKLGVTDPSMTIVCSNKPVADAPTAPSVLAFGIGTSEVEHVLAPRSLAVSHCRSSSASRWTATGLAVDGKRYRTGAPSGGIETNGAHGCLIEYAGRPFAPSPWKDA